MLNLNGIWTVPSYPYFSDDITCVSQDSPEKQKQRDIHRRQTDRKSGGGGREIRGDLLKELAHIVMEVKKIPQSTVCKPENQESQ